jgi:hypothetical protein
VTYSPRILALRAALRFMRFPQSWATTRRFWRDYHTTVAFDVEEPTFASKEYCKNPEITMHLREDWKTAVHGRGLDQLPTSPTMAWHERLMILHVGAAHFISGDELVAPAIWTRGRKSAHGWIAWRRNPEDWRTVTAWAVGRTAVAAQDELDKWVKPMRPNPEDAVALSDIQF